MLKRLMHTILFSCFLSIFLCHFAYAESTADALFHSPTDPVAGNPKGKITLVEFFDYQCSHCIMMDAVVNNIIRANPDLRVVFKEFPILGEMSTLATRAALAVNKQNKAKYMDFHEALMTTNKPLTAADFFAIAKKLGLNLPRLKQDMYSDSISQQVNNNLALAHALGLNGTPVFFFAKTREPSDYQFHLGDMSQQAMQGVIDKLKG